MTKHSVRVNLYTILSRAVEEGAQFGVNRAYKHTDTPSREALCESIVNEVMLTLCEVIEFEEDE